MAEKRKKMPRPLPVAALLETIFAGKPLQKRLREARAWQFWSEAVGAHIASKATPVSFRDGVLTVRVSNSPWMQQLSLMKSDIISSLNAAIGELLVIDIFFKQGTVSRTASELTAEPAAKRSLSDRERKSLAESTASVADPELREAFMSLFSSQLAASPRKQSL